LRFIFVSCNLAGYINPYLYRCERAHTLSPLLTQCFYGILISNAAACCSPVYHSEDLCAQRLLHVGEIKPIELGVKENLNVANPSYRTCEDICFPRIFRKYMAVVPGARELVFGSYHVMTSRTT
jgi:hypothetical protein